MSFLVGTLAAKRLELLHLLAPQATTIAALVHQNSPQAKVERVDLPDAARAMNLRLLILDIGSERDIEGAFASAAQNETGAVFVGGGGFLTSLRLPLVAQANRHKLPISFVVREPVEAGGLMSYGPSQGDAYRQAGGYVARILKGEKPAEMPVLQSIKFEFVLNLKTAKALGLQVSDRVLALVDEVIE